MDYTLTTPLYGAIETVHAARFCPNRFTFAVKLSIALMFLSVLFFRVLGFASLEFLEQ